MARKARAKPKAAKPKPVVRLDTSKEVASAGKFAVTYPGGAPLHFDPEVSPKVGVPIHFDPIKPKPKPKAETTIKA